MSITVLPLERRSFEPSCWRCKRAKAGVNNRGLCEPCLTLTLDVEQDAARGDADEGES